MLRTLYAHMQIARENSKQADNLKPTIISAIPMHGFPYITCIIHNPLNTENTVQFRIEAIPHIYTATAATLGLNTAGGVMPCASLFVQPIIISILV